MAKKAVKKGGARAGAGRKADPHGRRIGTSMTLTADVIEFLDLGAGSRSDKVEALVRNSKGFKEFLSSREQP